MPKDETLSANRLKPGAEGVSIVLLTGPSGSGKSTLAALLERRGWDRIDGDALAKSLYVPGCPLLRSIAKEFGDFILKSDASLDAQRLGEIVFPSVTKRKALNRLVYPPFLRALRGRLRAARLGRRPCVADVAVYFDLGAPRLGIPVVLVQAPLKLRLARLTAKGLTPARALARAKALRFGAVERKSATFVIQATATPKNLMHDFERGLRACQRPAIPGRHSQSQGRR